MNFVTAATGRLLARHAGVFICLVLLGALCTGSAGLAALAGRGAAAVPHTSQVSVFLCVQAASDPACRGQAATDQQVRTVRSAITSTPGVERTGYLDAARALEQFRRQQSQAPQRVQVEQFQVAPYFAVRVADPQAADLLRSRVEGLGGVAGTHQSDEDNAHTSRRLHQLMWAAIGVALMLGLIWASVVATSCHYLALRVADRLAIAREAGATPGALRLPFVLFAGGAAVLGGLLGFAGALTVRELLGRFTGQAARALHAIGVVDLTAVGALGCLAAVVLAGIVPAIAAVRHDVRA